MFEENLTQNDLYVIHNAINEVCNGFYISEFEKKIGVSKCIARELFEKIDAFSKQKLTVDDLLIIVNILSEVCKEIDDFEFTTRMGVTREDVSLLILKLKSLI